MRTRARWHRHLPMPGWSWGPRPTCRRRRREPRAEKVDARTDLFSLGTVVYEMATGRRAFPKPFDWTVPNLDVLPASLRPVVSRLLAVERDRRYQAATDVVSDLTTIQRSVEG